MTLPWRRATRGSRSLQVVPSGAREGSSGSKLSRGEHGTWARAGRVLREDAGSVAGHRVRTTATLGRGPGTRPPDAAAQHEAGLGSAPAGLRAARRVRRSTRIIRALWPSCGAWSSSLISTYENRLVNVKVRLLESDRLGVQGLIPDLGRPRGRRSARAGHYRTTIANNGRAALEMGGQG